MKDDENGAQTARRCVTITNTRGLHARAAAKFAGTTGNFDADVQVTRNEQTVSGLSIMGLMMLAAAPGSEIDLAATGPDAEAAINALAALVADKFQEE
ncbi:MAG: HPr family phosphocarrier protein [Rhodospirillales bacterium]|nr:HPr family phosphocarrier protein [Rhodospirillales bacterium]